MKIIEQPTKPYSNRQWLYEKDWRCGSCKALIRITPEDVKQGVVKYIDQDPNDQRGNDWAECNCPCCGHAIFGVYPGGGERR